MTKQILHSKVFISLALVMLFLAYKSSAQPTGGLRLMTAAKSVYIQNDSGDESLPDAVHLVLSTSNLKWGLGNRGSGDVVLHYTKKTETQPPVTQGQAISIQMKYTYVLTVEDQAGEVLWAASEVQDFANLRKDRTEASWIAYLHASPGAKLTTQFLQARGAGSAK